MSVPVYVALLHYPMVNRNGAIVTTAVTNMDIHDISRSARTFGAKGYFILAPIEDQQELVGKARGALHKVLCLTPDARGRGVV